MPAVITQSTPFFTDDDEQQDSATKRQIDRLKENDGGIGSLVIGLQGITEFMSGVGSQLKRYDPLVYPDNAFEDVVDFSNQSLIGASSIPISHLQAPVRLCFIPNVRVECKIVRAEPIASYTDMDFMSSYLYTIRLKHGKFVWEIVRRYRQFYQLHKQLIKYVTALMNRSISDALAGINADAMDIPKLPLPNDLIAKLNVDNIGSRSLALENYLNNILRYPKFKDQEATKEFLEVSVLSFIDDLGPRFKEGPLKKRSVDDLKGRKLFNRCKCMREEKWFAVKDSYICYIQPKSQELAFPILFDHGFAFSHGFRHTTIQNGLRISNLQKKLYLKAKNDYDVSCWVQAVEQAQKQGEAFLMNSRYNSFAPVRKSCRGKWFINGRDYMSTVAEAIERAKEEIFITDWWLSPEIYLRRPMKKDDKTYRLDHLLTKKANEGVRVYILIFREVRLALSLDSLHSKQRMREKNPQFIKVIRHPNHVAKTLLWSHHEKSVVVDQKIAFVGGIDLCFGRWDDENYRLTDLGLKDQQRTSYSSLIPTPSPSGPTAYIELPTDDANQQPQLLVIPHRIPGQNIALTMLSPLGPTAQANSPEEPQHLKLGVRKSIGNILHSRHRSQSNRSESSVHHHRRHETVAEISDDSDDEETNQQDAQFEADIKAAEIEYDEKGGAEMHLWPGKDYSNSYMKDFVDVKKFFEDNVDRNSIQRMPWHDEAAVILGEGAQDVARHFIQRWNDAKRAKHRLNQEYPYLLPKAYFQADQPDDSWLTSVHDIDVQVLRSVCSWSAGISIIESSILTAYCDLIKSASHYIFMENQFFITSTSQSDVVKNGIGSAIFDRIMRAHWNHENFRMYVVVPIVPGFDGKEAIKAIMHFTMRSICAGENCLFKKLKKEGGISDPEKYIRFFGMRNYDMLNGNLVSEIIYVHSKLMIVDDRRAIVGSANINDRSLIGFRDSELAILIEDKTLVPGRLNGTMTKVGPFCSSWRRTIFEHLFGIGTKSYHVPIDISDPCTDEFFDKMTAISKKNTETYVNVMGCIPNDVVRNFEQLNAWTKKEFIATKDPEKALKILQDNIQGFIVDLPLYFIYDENYYPLNKTKEGLAPYVMWT